MSEWKAFNARITLFPTTPQPGPSAREVYQRVWSSEPEGFQNPSNALQPSVAHGSRAGISVNCLAHATRVDFNFSPLTTPSGAAEPGLTLIEDTPQLYSELKQIIKVLAEGILSSPVSRVALGLQFVTIKANSLEANKALTEVMPQQYRVNVSDERDFILQVNRPRKSSKIDGVNMNFLTKWSVENVQMVTMSVPVGGAPIPTAVPWINSFLTASVSFDHNNVAERPLETEEQSQLSRECLDEASRTQKNIGLNVEGF